ncbi:2-aminoethylphosphonate ABC transporter substrate-binding protein [Mycobacterium sp. CVI_P3]|uniref:2-aminoethylphosphonate ABC transporter substrate-binding protein n=1 Tax=Mycobacterium pinniadriaticum TaxID=2994102 RepID=A0ABT3S9J5_9MYCO|nr:2-aminoethylphosphonate ABC transporter substrate-binding protein [Mycobacterium pinniadriaticum]MCX2929764.1 2-aminoethylphosphonate ABC transporter substrate-binding protein [Mycobacterium pinniadriaticum]MCX2936188.1 2-aminoethylphosphonate ABC transporter substrate-binding protein [Mycobacterium pinniadriaticum]
MNIRKLTAAVTAAAVAMLVGACGGTGTSGSGDGTTLTVYTADGLGTWYKSQFAKFTKDTGINVNMVEAGSGEVVSRVEKEQSNPQADLLVTLPPFIQKADKSGLLQASGADTTGISPDLVGPDGNYVAIVNNALSFIANPGADPQPASWDDLLKPEFKGKLQYSTPGQAGDGTAVLVLLQHLMGKPGALDYLGKLQVNNVGPSSSTGKLQPKVSNGELLVANGDVQMNLGSIKDDGSKFNIFFPAMADHSRTTVALPYVAGVTKGAPHADDAKKLLAFLISDDVQKTVAPEALGIPVKDAIAKTSTVSSDTNTPTGLLNGVQVWTPDWNAVLTDLDADLAAYQKATGS